MSILHSSSRIPQNSELGTITHYEPQNTSEETKLNSDLSENDIKSIEKDSQEEPNDEIQTEGDADGEVTEETKKYINKYYALLFLKLTCFNRSKRIVPFFTILNAPQPTGVKLIKSFTSKLGLTGKCTSKNFQKTMKKVEKLTNYEHVLTCMVDDINKEIDTCYMTCQKISGGQLSKVINIFTKKSCS